MPSCWLPIPPDSDFTLSNIPFGIITSPLAPSTPHTAIAIGSHVLDLHALSDASSHGFPSPISAFPNIFRSPTLNAFAAQGRAFHRETRRYLQTLLTDGTHEALKFRNNMQAQKECLIRRDEVKNLLPMEIGDYTDFYAGLNHAYNVGVLFRGAQNALQPNYRHLPVGYHGRASTVVVSGTPIRRPWGQVLDPDTKTPKFQPCAKLDLELELGAFVCKPSEMGTPVPIAEAEEYLFGVVLLNDWSARDVQAWEYVPLGPFNAKNFGTTVSPWVVLADALEPFRCEPLPNEVETLPYLREGRRDTVFDIKLEVDLITKNSVKHELTRTSGSNLLWSFPKMLAHHTVTGCSMRTGDLLGSGTISGTEPGSEGSLLEQSKNGKIAVALADSSESRTFLEDGDTVAIRGSCQRPGQERIGFGECRGVIEPAIKLSI